MRLEYTKTPAERLAYDLEESVRNAPHEQVLCFCAGGSALTIFSHLKDESVKRRTIFMMGDERASGEEAINNYLQLKKRLIHDSGFTIVPTVYTDTSVAAYAKRLTETIQKIFSSTPTTKFAILGIGEDGHTAGIFPLSKESFEEIYKDEGIYVPVEIKGLTIDSRASLTPHFILNTVDRLFGYVAGDAKKEILEKLINEDRAMHERPAELLKRHKNVTLYTDIAL